MTLREDSKLQIEIHGKIERHDYHVLTMLYYPLIHESAYLLYEMMAALADEKMSFDNHLILVKVSGLRIEVIERERKVLEKYQLLKTYYSQKLDRYIYELYPPKKPTEFLEHEVFGRMYLDLLGEQVFRFQKQAFLQESLRKQEYEDISECISDVIREGWNEHFENTFSQMQEEIQEQRDGSEIIFNYDAFLLNFKNVWPPKKRSAKLLKEIGRVATLYGIHPQTMRGIVSRSLDKDGNLDVDAMRKRAANSKAKYETDEVNIYKWPPVRFLQNKQKGVEVSRYDRETIRILLEEYKLHPEVVNVLIDYVLQKANQRFPRNFVESVAGSWLRSNIETYEQAVAYMHNPTKTTKDEKVLISYDEEDTMSEDERQRLIEEIRQRRLANGES
ncbi:MULTISPECIES: DnaD domain protein [unclassified Breznakia]|uniref:DnaD domain protein n=1 Tax=unclassified Breznakia TaxID=2623764 RepID=UPI0024748F14|nr:MULTISPECIES: DnaD domain protein [unclassified Breznakia]MDH6366442.1 replication initiation and membrane attachment protein [Breznakia sp. PH1-1]MDH6403535.1 replication initiation and membrane attachment protein [Breznakia sp. PF1-11]MDH6411244.1 replication initiation and membrane attachment protein [Breznakia sp. PFB1-11]MDH6413493.1 replication initiation and membrane attachment protein [Breznakia sp. PFB1-14]MDH6415789.1 replication initiation and membrane attachment protein [Breznak